MDEEEAEIISPEEMKRNQYFGLLLATSAQIIQPDEYETECVRRAARLIEACAQEAEVNIDEIR